MKLAKLSRPALILAFAVLTVFAVLPILNFNAGPRLPIRLAFYYAWFPSHWTENGLYPFANYHPTLGYYNSSDPAIIRQHVTAMQYGRIDGAISSWWGRVVRTHTKIASTSYGACADEKFLVGNCSTSYYDSEPNLKIAVNRDGT